MERSHELLINSQITGQSARLATPEVPQAKVDQQVTPCHTQIELTQTGGQPTTVIAYDKDSGHEVGRYEIRPGRTNLITHDGRNTDHNSFNYGLINSQYHDRKPYPLDVACNSGVIVDVVTLASEPEPTAFVAAAPRAVPTRIPEYVSQRTEPVGSANSVGLWPSEFSTAAVIIAGIFGGVILFNAWRGRRAQAPIQINRVDRVVDAQQAAEHAAEAAQATFDAMHDMYENILDELRSQREDAQANRVDLQAWQVAFLREVRAHAADEVRRRGQWMEDRDMFLRGTVERLVREAAQARADNGANRAETQAFMNRVLDAIDQITRQSQAGRAADRAQNQQFIDEVRRRIDHINANPGHPGQPRPGFWNRYGHTLARRIGGIIRDIIIEYV